MKINNGDSACVKEVIFSFPLKTLVLEGIFTCWIITWMSIVQLWLRFTRIGDGCPNFWFTWYAK